MDTSGQNMDYMSFFRMSKPALMDYCKKHGFPVTGNKEELAAMAYTAQRTNAAIQPSEVEKILLSRVEYKKRLVLPSGKIIEDPLKLTTGWIGEADGGTKHWPQLTYDMIYSYLKNSGIDTTEAGHVNAYKEGKAFSYFQCQFVKEVKVQEKEEYTLLKCQVTRSQCLSDDPHTVWAAFNNNGLILSAYCSCTAGLHMTCNHLAGMLFRIEAAVKEGLVDPSCTSLPSQWNVPSSKTTVKIQEIADVNFIQPKAGKTRSRPLVHPVKKAFWPLSGRVTDQEVANTVDALKAKLSLSAKSSVLAMMTQPRSPKSATPPSPSPLMLLEDTIRILSLRSRGSLEDRVNYIMLHLPKASSNDIKSINNMTVGQGDNDNWVKARKGRITASNFGAVVKRMKTLKDQASRRSKDVSSILASLMGYKTVNPAIPALAYGRKMEKVALQNYVKHQIENGHANVTVNSCGLFVYQEEAFLAASPDAVVSCTCCESGLVEIKCPESLRDAPSVQLASYLYIDDLGKARLKNNSDYYFQVQGQLGVCGKNYCDFVVFSEHDIFVERIRLNRAFWLEMHGSLVEFYRSYLLPEVLTQKSKPARTEGSSISAMTTDTTPTVSADQAIQNVACNAVVESCTASPHRVDNVPPTSFCPTCKVLCEDGETRFRQQSIMCETCQYWYHMKCVRMTKRKLSELGEEVYMCLPCKKLSRV